MKVLLPDVKTGRSLRIPGGGNGSWRILWILFACAIAGSFFIHELGHCAVAWLHGRAAVPTPMKEYILSPIPAGLQNQVALGGILGSVVALLGMVLWSHRKPDATRSALVAGAMTAPALYTLRFILFGRGHDGSEFQEAQAALGFAYAGHAIDWLFAALFIMAAVFWFWRTRQPVTLRFVGRVIVGSVAALFAAVLLQSVNNAIFDPLFTVSR